MYIKRYILYIPINNWPALKMGRGLFYFYIEEKILIVLQFIYIDLVIIIKAKVTELLLLFPLYI